MKKIMKIAMIAAVPLFFSSCIMLNTVSMTDISSETGTAVTAESSAMGFLSLTAPSASDLEKEALASLKSQGATKNITVRLHMRQWVIVQAYKVTATGEK